MLTPQESRQLMAGIVAATRYRCGDDNILFLQDAVNLINTFCEGVIWVKQEKDGKTFYSMKEMK